MLRVHWQFVNWDTLIYMSCLLIFTSIIFGHKAIRCRRFFKSILMKGMNVQDVCYACLQGIILDCKIFWGSPEVILKHPCLEASWLGKFMFRRRKVELTLKTNTLIEYSSVFKVNFCFPNWSRFQPWKGHDLRVQMRSRLEEGCFYQKANQYSELVMYVNKMFRESL